MRGHRPLLPVVGCAVWAGAWTVLSGWGWLLLGGCLVVGAACTLLRVSTLRAWSALVVVAAAVGGGAAGARLVAVTHSPVVEWAAQGAEVRVVAVLIDDPRPSARRAAGRLADGVVVRLRLDRVRARGREVRLRAPVVAVAPRRGWADLLPGTVVAADGRLAPAAAGQPVAALLVVRGPAELLAGPPAYQRAAGAVRAGLRTACRSLPPDVRGLLPGLVLGDTSGMAADLAADFRATGLTHLTAVSGANVAVVLAAALVAARWLGARAWWVPIAGGLAVAAFVVLVRPQPSVLRAATMGVIGLASLSAGHRGRGMPTLGAAVAALVLGDPWLARSWGFALSTVATAALLVLAPRVRDRLPRALPGPVADALAIAVAAQLAVAPLVAVLSAGVSLVAVPANLLAAPAVPAATVLGVVAAVASTVAPPVAALVAALAAVPTGWVALVARHGAELRLAVVPWPSSLAGAAGLAAALAGTALALGWLPSRWRRRVAAAGLAVAVVVLRLGPGAWPPPGWVLVACDVGQGDALVLAAGPGTAVVVDAGPDPARVDGCLRRLRVTEVPLVVLTHDHADHVEGLPGVLAGRRVGAVEVGPLDEPAEEWARVRDWTAGSGLPLVRAADGDELQVGPLRWRVLWPARVIRGQGSDPNNASVVLLVQVAGVSLLLGGDVEPAAQRALLAQARASGLDLDVDVLKVPHHGSRHQDPELLAATDPALAVVSVGADNPYGHPSSATVAALLAEGATVLRTDRDGDVAVVVGAGGVRAVVRGGGRP